VTALVVAADTVTEAPAAPVQATRRRRREREATGHPSAPVGPVDSASIEDVLVLVDALPTLSTWRNRPDLERQARRRGAVRLLACLAAHPATGWQQRWLAAGACATPGWTDALTDPHDPSSAAIASKDVVAGVAALVLCRVILPGYDFFTHIQTRGLFEHVRRCRRPDMFTRLEQAAAELQVRPYNAGAGIRAVTRMVIVTGRDVDQLTEDDLYEHRDWQRQTKAAKSTGAHVAWDLLRAIGVITAETSMPEALRLPPRTTEELVDLYDIDHGPIRQVLIRYLDERRPGLDFGSLRGLASVLVGAFWADIERHHPGIDTLHLPSEVVEAWKQRLQVLKRRDVAGQPRRGISDVFTIVRAFYLDIAEWALEDPSWVPWAAPIPIRKADTTGQAKRRRKVIAEMHQRIRERLPHLPTLVACAERHRNEQAVFLAAALTAETDTEFDHAGCRYRRLTRTTTGGGATRYRAEVEPIAMVEDVQTGKRINVTQEEEHAFWAWGIIETLRHTGVRLEELLDITHLALVSYRLPKTGEVVPMLQIVPSKSNEERLLLVSPELASVLATIITRLRHANGATVPLVTRYDAMEQVTGPPLPHLFQRRRGYRPVVLSTRFVADMLNATLDRAGLHDAAGQRLKHTAHDFRRMFATEAVIGGLPVHIAARLLGHHSLNTTQAYLAVFQDDLVDNYRAFLNRRRSMRPEAEYREPTEDEWRDFQQHFELRKVELGTCTRPYASPCRFEYACIRCPSLRIDPAQRGRLAEIIANLRDRIAEARINGWLGEVEGLQVSLDAAAAKLASLDRRNTAERTTLTSLGIPVIRDNKNPET
jgi:site-specific recombinase XerD